MLVWEVGPHSHLGPEVSQCDAEQGHAALTLEEGRQA